MGNQVSQPRRCPLSQLAFKWALGREQFWRIETDQARPGGITHDVDCVSVGHRKFLRLRSPDCRRNRLKCRLPEFKRLLTDGHSGHDQKSNHQALKTPSQPSACPAKMTPKQSLGLVARRIAGGGSRRQCNHIVLSPENFKNLLPLFIGKANLPAGSVEPCVDVGQEISLPGRQVLAKQCCFDVVSEVPSRVHWYCRLL
ncbi:hypothetical protein U8Q05_18740 [Rhizobium ruizarguesonis]|nr:hypothetical protein U8Q05_18740 [Rhizobium ruizarguesonis]